MKQGYEPFMMVFGQMKLSVTANGVTFSKAVTVKLGYPAYVTLLINAEEKLLALKSAESNDKNAIEFYKANDRCIDSVRINNKDLIGYLCSLMNWNVEENSYSIVGRFDYKEKYVEFDLKGYEIK